MADNDALVQTFLAACAPPQVPSQVLVHKEQVEQWHREGLRGTIIHQAVQRKYGFMGSYSSVRRFLQALTVAERYETPTTVITSNLALDEWGAAGRPRFTP